jgi:hypothetical protein
MKACLITANIGGIDASKSPIKNMFQYSDFPSKLPSRLQAKYYKMCSHWLHPEYDAYIWIDSSFTVQEGLIEWMVQQLGDADCAFFSHLHRSSIVDEADFVNQQMKAGNQYLLARYSGQKMTEQVNSYIDSGFNTAFGLYGGGLFIRRNTPKVNHAFDHWYIENTKWTIQDQLSLPYILWKHDLKFKVIDKHLLYRGPYHAFSNHEKNI